jgi:hypothetical protein
MFVMRLLEILSMLVWSLCLDVRHFGLVRCQEFLGISQKILLNPTLYTSLTVYFINM